MIELGIELHCNCQVGKDIPFEQLRRDYDAVFAGTGAWQAVPLNVPGEDAVNVIGALNSLPRFNGH